MSHTHLLNTEMKNSSVALWFFVVSWTAFDLNMYLFTYSTVKRRNLMMQMHMLNMLTAGNFSPVKIMILKLYFKCKIRSQFCLKKKKQNAKMSSQVQIAFFWMWTQKPSFRGSRKAKSQRCPPTRREKANLCAAAAVRQHMAANMTNKTCSFLHYNEKFITTSFLVLMRYFFVISYFCSVLLCFLITWQTNR